MSLAVPLHKRKCHYKNITCNWFVLDEISQNTYTVIFIINRLTSLED